MNQNLCRNESKKNLIYPNLRCTATTNDASGNFRGSEISIKNIE